MKGIARNFSPNNKGIKIEVDGKEEWFTVKDTVYENFVQGKINKGDTILFSLVDDKVSYIKTLKAGESTDSKEEPKAQSGNELMEAIDKLDKKIDTIINMLGA